MTLTPHSIINGDACFAYFNKIWGIPCRGPDRPFHTVSTNLVDRRTGMILGAPVLWLSSRLEFERLDGPVTMTVADLIERRNPVVVAGDGLPIDDAGPRPKPRQRLDDQRKALLRSLLGRL